MPVSQKRQDSAGDSENQADKKIKKNRKGIKNLAYLRLTDSAWLRNMPFLRSPTSRINPWATIFESKSRRWAGHQK